MADSNEFHQILGKALTDEHFRKALHDDPESALKSAGVESTPEKVQALKSASDSLSKVHQAFGGKTPIRPS